MLSRLLSVAARRLGPYSLYLKLAGGALLVAGVFYGGFTTRGWIAEGQLAIKEKQMAVMREDAHKAYMKSVQATLDYEAERSKALRLAEEKAALEDAARRDHRQVITQEVVKYVASDSGRECGIDPDGVRVLDAAAADPAGVSQAGTAARGSDDAAAGASATHVVATVSDNYLTYHEVAGQLVKLQAWVRSTCGGR